MDEQDLITGLKQRDPDALAALFQQNADKLYRLAVSLLHDDQQADGVVQDTFMRLITHINSFEGRSNVSTWLYRVAYNECLLRLRRARPAVELDSMDEEGEMMPTALISWDEVPDEIASSREAQAVMERAINNLKPELRAVFTLRDVEELTTRETADSLGISETLVKVRLHRARLALREQLAAYFEERAEPSARA